ncbi:LptF/LptG family permease [Petrotoga sp. 9PWA.NaAc.5.4]|uniref:LptF/LptG family permease n=1 Tax=Petrotoga sp. 9PWA.NaAc.5.4 TaxID=1434328 RepID=UPI000CBCB6CC|nr:LptF/LptG family permease [Petrotoga sp. 9PWA.NaAc.5.4]PNR95290.1 permease [Petrotoga sp. 9PWA.NaAc.5.4]
MKKLFKYVSKEFIPPFLMGIIAFIVFVSVELLYQLSEIIVRNNVGFSKLLVLIWYHLPYFISMGIPVGVLFAVFWVVSKLSSANEIIALQTLGIPMKKFVIPFVVISLILCFFTFALFDTIVPKSNYKAKEVMALYVYQRPQAQIEENQFVNVGDGRYLFVKQLDRENGILYDVLLYEVGKNYTTVFNAQEAQKAPDGWYMKNGKMFKTNKDGFLDLDVSFEQLELDIDQEVEEFLNLSKGANEMTSKELKEKIQTFSKLGLDVSGLVVSYQSKFANSLAPLVICVLGIALSLFLNLSSKSWSVIITFVLVIIYQGSGAWLSALGKEKIIDPLIAAWIPNIIFGAIGLFLFLILDTKFSYKLLEPLRRILPLILIIIVSISAFPSPVNITADFFYLRDNLLILEDNVYVVYEGSIIKSDRAQGELKNDGTIKSATFYGNVNYLYEDISIQASEITVNFEEDSVVFLNSYTVQKYQGEKEVNIKIWSDKIEKPVDENTIQAKETRLTTCEECVTYYFSAKKVDIYPGYFLIARDLTLSFFGVPVLYLPFYFQTLSPDEDEPFSLTFNYGENQIDITTEINYKFDNGSKFHFSNTSTNNLKTGAFYDSYVLRYGVPFLSGELFFFSEILKSNGNLGLYYQFFEEKNKKPAKLEFKVNPYTNQSLLSLNIPTLKTNLGDLKNINSYIQWNEDGFEDILFLNLETQALQKRYGRSLLSLSKLTFNSRSYGDISDLPFSEIWNNKENHLELAGKYNLYSGFANSYGNFNYNFTNQSTTTTKNRLSTQNTFSYRDSLFEYQTNNFNLDLNMQTGLRFNHTRDFIPNDVYSDGKTLFEYSLKPGIDINLYNFDLGNSLEYVKVLENSLTPSATDQLNYNDYIGYSFSLFNNNFSNYTKLSRSYNLLNKTEFPELSSLILDNQSQIKILGSNNTLYTKSYFNVEDSDNIFLDKTSVRLTNTFTNYTHRSEFDVLHQEEKKIEYLKNREIIRYQRNRLQLDYNLYIHEKTFVDIIPEISTNYTFYYNDNKIFGNFDMKNEYTLYDLNLNFLEKNSEYSFGLDFQYSLSDFIKSGFQIINRDKSEFASAYFNYDLKNNTWDFTEFQIQKQIVCWTVRFNAKFSVLPQPMLTSFSFMFFINYIPDKNVTFGSEGIEFGLL